MNFLSNEEINIFLPLRCSSTYRVLTVPLELRYGIKAFFRHLKPRIMRNLYIHKKPQNTNNPPKQYLSALLPSNTFNHDECGVCHRPGGDFQPPNGIFISALGWSAIFSALQSRKLRLSEEISRLSRLTSERMRAQTQVCDCSVMPYFWEIKEKQNLHSKTTLNIIFPSFII